MITSLPKPPVTRVYDSAPRAREAIQALETAGIASRSISVVTRSPRDAEKLEHDTGASDDLEDAAYRTRLREFADWLSRVGSAAVPAFGAVLGTGDLWQDVAIGGRGPGSITGALVGAGLPVNEADELEKAVFSGKILVVVHGPEDAASVQHALQASH